MILPVEVQDGWNGRGHGRKNEDKVLETIVEPKVQISM